MYVIDLPTLQSLKRDHAALMDFQKDSFLQYAVQLRKSIPMILASKIPTQEKMQRVIAAQKKLTRYMVDFKRKNVSSTVLEEKQIHPFPLNAPQLPPMHQIVKPQPEQQPQPAMSGVPEKFQMILGQVHENRRSRALQIIRAVMGSDGLFVDPMSHQLYIEDIPLRDRNFVDVLQEMLSPHVGNKNISIPDSIRRFLSFLAKRTSLGSKTVLNSTMRQFFMAEREATLKQEELRNPIGSEHGFDPYSVFLAHKNNIGGETLLLPDDWLQSPNLGIAKKTKKRKLK
jgi:hypothetical protein